MVNISVGMLAVNKQQTLLSTEDYLKLEEASKMAKEKFLT